MNENFYFIFLLGLAYSVVSLHLVSSELAFFFFSLCDINACFFSSLSSPKASFLLSSSLNEANFLN